MFDKKQNNREFTPKSHDPSKHSGKSLPARPKSLAVSIHKAGQTSQKLKYSDYELYDYKVTKLIKTLQNRLSTFESYAEAKKFWRDQCARFIECSDLKLKPVHPVGRLLIKNGQFMVMYAQLLEMDPHINSKELRDYFLEHYGGTIIKNSLIFRRHFGLAVEQENKQPNKIKTETKKPPLSISKTKTPLKPEPPCAQGQGPSLKRLPTFQQARRQRKSITFRQFMIKTGQKRPQDFTEPSQPPQIQSPFPRTYPPYIQLSEQQCVLIKSMGIQQRSVYDETTAEVQFTINPNFMNKDMFSLCMIKRKVCWENELPILAVCNLKRFAQTDKQTIEQLLQIHRITAFYKKNSAGKC